MFSFFKHQKEAKARQRALDEKAPKNGDPAPDFKLFDNNGTNPVRLADFKHIKPVGLVFGSFT